MDYDVRVQNIADSLLKRSGLPREKFPQIALILGSGLGGLANHMEEQIIIPYDSLSGFPSSDLQGHAGMAAIGRLNGVPVVCFSGRVHLYDGFDAKEVCIGVRCLGLLGVKTLIISNAAGALNPFWQAGELMLITDHINLTGHNPLTGPNNERWGVRYPDMSSAYCPQLQRLALDLSLRLGLRLNAGVYAALPGPSLETPAETRALRHMGADAVGMSTVLEVIAARHMGLRVLGFSCLTNKNLPDCMGHVTEKEIIEVAGKAGHDLTRLVSELLKQLA